jgi:hypothetical protein
MLPPVRSPRESWKICYTQRFGAVPKWPKGEVCKTSIRGFESHPRLQISRNGMNQLGRRFFPGPSRVPFVSSAIHQVLPRCGRTALAGRESQENWGLALERFIGLPETVPKTPETNIF